MNVFGEKKRGWRKARKRGVSPIIATILLVAITVVLAAVLYVLISGLTSGPGNAPLGSHFGWGNPTNLTGSNTTCSATSVYCYGIEIASASSVTTSSVTLGLHSAAGTATPFPSGTKIALLSAQGAVVATYSITTNGWTAAKGFSGSFASGMSLQIICTGTGSGLLGDSIIAIGGGSYSGTVGASAFP